MATFVKTPHGHWKAVVRRRGWPTACRTFRLKHDAQDWARHTEDGIRRSIHIHLPAPDRMLFSEALDRYLREVTSTKAPGTRIKEVRRMRPLRAFFGRYVLAAITPDLIARYREQRLSTPIRSPRHPYRPPAPATVRLEFALLTHLFNVAIREWRLGMHHNPVNGVQAPPPSPGRERRLESHEETRLMSALARYRNPMLGWIVRIAIETGMRAGEIGSLRMSQVDLSWRTVQLHRTKNGSTRTVPLTKAATHVLSKAIAHTGRPPGCDLIFFAPFGRDRTARPYGFLIAWWKLKKRLGLDDLHFHDLRHEAISRLVEAGLSDQQVASISGHKSMQMLKRYTHLRAQELVAVLDRRTLPDGSLSRCGIVTSRTPRGKRDKVEYVRPVERLLRVAPVAHVPQV